MNRAATVTLFSAVLFGTTFPAIRFGLEEGGLGPYAFLYYRFVIATALMATLAGLTRRLDLSLFREPKLLGLATLAALGYVLQHLAQDQTTASKASLLVNIHVVTVALLGFLFLSERHGREMFLAILLGLAGSFLLTTNGDLDTIRWSNAEFVGDVLAFASGACWAFYTVGLKQFLTRRPHTDGVALGVVVFTTLLVVLLPVLYWTEGLVHRPTPAGWISLAYLGVFVSNLAFLWWQEGLRGLKATASSVLLLAEIVVAVALGVAFLDERLGWWGLLGATGVILAALLASRSTPETPVAPEQTIPA